jgi:hypothetical protein
MLERDREVAILDPSRHIGNVDPGLVQVWVGLRSVFVSHLYLPVVN